MAFAAKAAAASTHVLVDALGMQRGAVREAPRRATWQIGRVSNEQVGDPLSHLLRVFDEDEPAAFAGGEDKGVDKGAGMGGVDGVHAVLDQLNAEKVLDQPEGQEQVERGWKRERHQALLSFALQRAHL